MTYLKRILVIILAITFCIGLSGCGAMNSLAKKFDGTFYKALQDCTYMGVTEGGWTDYQIEIVKNDIGQSTMSGALSDNWTVIIDPESETFTCVKNGDKYTLTIPELNTAIYREPQTEGSSWGIGL